MQPTASGIRAQGEAEYTGTIHANGRLEGSAVYSPLPHVLVNGAATFRPKIGDTTYTATRQWEAGAGTYWALGQHLIVTGMAGVGQANSRRGFLELPGIFSNAGVSLTDYQARYNKVYGQLGLHYDFRGGSIGANYRLTHLQFQSFTYRNSELQMHLPVSMPRMLRHEPMLYGRIDLDRARPRRWQLQGSVGLSYSQGPEQKGEERIFQQEINRTRMPLISTSVGVVFRPDWLRGESKNSKAAAEKMR
ncbi:hypothetical protein [Hymenobacter koreensis]|uniref:Uncharacterized protein n=1 Tax=Hymenobacter koreensis TaxID=1084523 RepID=A0ABP8ITT3_9BACT